jgi:hypothetical protein
MSLRMMRIEQTVTPAFEAAVEERDLAIMSFLPGWLRS